VRKELHCPIWRPDMARIPFLSPFWGEEERNDPPSADQGLFVSAPEGRDIVLEA